MRWFDFLRHKHRWEVFSDGFKRRCRCGAEQWVFENRFPAIGDPALNWRDIHRPLTDPTEDTQP